MAVRNKLAQAAGTLLDESVRPGSVAQRRHRLDEPHVADLEAWAQEVRDRTGESVPSFDPSSAGTAARLLVLREEPRCLATQGSGFVSIDNDDAAAQNTALALTEAGLQRGDVLHWNVVPWWIRNPEADDRTEPRTVLGQARRARPLLATLLGLLPDVRAVVLLGREASRAWSVAGPPELAVLAAPHPSPLAWNSRDRATGRRNSELVLETFTQAADLLDDDVEQRLEQSILALLGRRGPGRTICPSEAARAVGTEDRWRELMEPARRAARRLVEAGDVQVTQGGQVVDPATARGPIRIRRR